MEETKEKMKVFQEENISLMEIKKQLEERIQVHKNSMKANKTLLKDKENEISMIKEEVKLLEKFRDDKPKLEKKVMDFTKQNHSLKEEVE